MKLLNESNWIYHNKRLIEDQAHLFEWIDSFEPNSKFFDVGACTGEFGAYALLRGHETHFFEPETKNFQRLSENLERLKPSAPYVLNKTGLFSYSGEVPFYIGQDSPGGHHKFIKHSGFSGDPSLEPYLSREPSSKIRVITLDQYESHPDYLKIDVDGAELQVLEGAREALKRVREIFIELKNPVEILDFRIVESYQVNPHLSNFLYRRLRGGH